MRSKELQKPMTMLEYWQMKSYDVWGLRFVGEGRTERWNTAGHELFISKAKWWRFITLSHLLLMFQILHNEKYNKTKQNKKNLVNHFFFIVSGRPIIFHLTTALNCYQSSTTLPPFCQHSLRILTQSQSLNWQWHGLLATAPKQLVKKLTNQGQLAAFKKRAVVFKRCLLPCILKQHLKDCLQGAGRAQGRRALNQVINSD